MRRPAPLPRRSPPLAPTGLLAALLLGCGGASETGPEDAVDRGAGDLVAARSVLEVADTVPGDVMLAGSEITFRGRAGGDYLGAGDVQAVGGSVGGDVRAAGDEVTLTAWVSDNATVAGRVVELGSGGTVEGNAYLAGGSVRVEGTVRGRLRAMGREVVLDGVAGPAEVTADRLVVGPGARIRGDLRYRVPPENVSIDPAAVVTGQRIALPARRIPDVGAWLRAILLLGFLAAGAAVVALLPRAAVAAERVLQRRPWAALGYGLFWIFAVPAVVVLLAATVVGIPLALIVCGLYLAGLFLAPVAPALWVGRRLRHGRAGPSRGQAVLSFLIGAALLAVAGLLPLLGPLVFAAATLVGFGAFVLAFWHRAVNGTNHRERS